MDKRQVIQRICELDSSAKFGFLANFSQEDLECHLRLLLARRKPGSGDHWQQRGATQPGDQVPQAAAAAGSGIAG